MNCIDTFAGIYHHEPAGVAFCPYRVCPIGAHIDHQYGKVTGFAIDKGIHIAYGPKQNGVIELASLNFQKRAQFHVREVPKEKQGDWADYLRGAARVLSQSHPLSVGLCGVIEGGLPIGGLSSSAAVTIAFLSALCKVNNIRLTANELIHTALDAENNYVGVSCGKLDQSCEIYCRKDHLLYLDTKYDSFELIPASSVMKPFEIAVFFSGIERTLVGSKFNMRVDECKSAAYALMAYAGMEYGKFEEARLRNVPFEVFEQYRDKLPENWRKRAEHFYSEFERVERGAEAWRKGDVEAFGRLSFESGRSSVEKYETGSPELKTLFEIMLKTDGIFGGRFSGAGFKGCCMALIDPSFEEKIKEQVSAEYLKVFPGLNEKYSVHFCKTTDGIRF
ncbi:MAG TPA: galactokinase family protein [Oscillospiraceae bacterium]|nr:galactokinase family protein [Oscillospiraceae bacterium]HPS35130.1 galactokinase family protein [Oscillospiraceae bacterium]